MDLTLKGTVVKKGDLQEFNDGSFKKREIVVRIDEDSKWPQEIPVEVVNNNVGILDPIKVGDKISIDCNLRGNEYNGRNFVSIPGWRLNVLESGGGDTASTDQPAPDPAPTTQAEAADDGVDDLPF